MVSDIPGSSNGRTGVFGAPYGGSNPSPGTMKKVFIFGAGASLGSQQEYIHNQELLPPLSNDLFRNEYVGYAQQLGLSMEDFKRYRTEIEEAESVEQWLTSLWDSANKQKTERNKKAIQSEFGKITYYMWRLLQVVSNAYDPTKTIYVDLIRSLKDREEDFGLITFNYDTLLDQAVQDIFHEVFEDFSQYLDFPLLKLHGSINWLLKMRPNDSSADRSPTFDIAQRIRIFGRQMYTNESPFSLEDLQVLDPKDLTLNNTHDLVRHMINTSHYYPLMFLPVISKQYAFVNEFENRVLNKAKKLLWEAEEIFVIGYRANDKVIEELLKGIPQGKRFVVVGRDTESAKETAQKIELIAPQFRKRVEHFPGSFKNFVEKYRMFGSI